MLKSEEKNKRKSAAYRTIRRRNIALGVFSFLILTVICVFTPIFGVSEISVSGTKILSPDAVIKASGISNNDNILFVNTKKSEQSINKLGYIDKVSVKRKFLTRIEIDVVEATEVAYIAFSGNYVGIDENGKVLSVTKSSKLKPKKAVVSGLAIKRVSKGQIIEVKNDAKFELLKNLIGSLKGNEILSRTSAINITDVSHISITLDSKTKILFGNSKDLDYKIEYAKVVLDNQQNIKGGTIDITDTSNVIYHPEEGRDKK